MCVVYHIIYKVYTLIVKQVSVTSKTTVSPAAVEMNRIIVLNVNRVVGICIVLNSSIKTKCYGLW